MLSFTQGKAIAIIKNGKYHNKILYIKDPDKKCCRDCSEECEDGPRCCDDCAGGCFGCIDNNPLDVVNEESIRKHKKKMSKYEMGTIKRALQKNKEPFEDDLTDIFKKLKCETEEKSKKEFKIFDDGIIQPLPDFKSTYRTYVCGPTESGKSYYVKKLISQYIKVFPDKKVYVFSDVDEDPELDSISNVIRIKIDEAILKKKPIKPEVLRDSIVIFDDIDSIQNKNVDKIIKALRDSLLRRGRHENISVICTSHLCSNYSDSRITLNECQSIVFFGRSGATHAIQYTLKKYGGLTAKQIEEALSLPSRWVSLTKTYPQYILYEKGAYIL